MRLLSANLLVFGRIRKIPFPIFAELWFYFVAAVLIWLNVWELSPALTILMGAIGFVAAIVLWIRVHNRYGFDND